MKLNALATLAATGAFAQSSVTLFGLVDANYRSVTSGDNKFSGMAQDGNASSRLGFRGEEDLGGGMKANFHLEGALNPDTGTSGGFNFMRKSTVGLQTNFGEVRFGRDYTPLFAIHGIADPFGTVGVGSALNMLGSTVTANALGGTAMSAQDAQDRTGTFTTTDRGTERRTDASGLRAGGLITPRITYADPNAVRANNSFAYYSPIFSGASAALMYSTGAKNTYGLKKTGKMTGGSITYADGPLTVAAATQQTTGGYTAAAASWTPTAAAVNTPTNATNGTDDQKWKTNMLVGAYDLGLAKAALGYRQDKVEIPNDTGTIKSMIYSVTAPFGPQLTLKASYITKKGDGQKMGNQLAGGVVYDLSKRTALYATYAQIKNEAGFANTVGSALTSAGGEKSKGFDIGVRHSF